MRWDIDELDVRQGDNRLTARGRVSETRLALDGELDLPALDTLHDALGGTLAGRFSAAGSLEAPQLDLSLSGEGLAFAEDRLSSLELSGRVSGIDDPDLDLNLAIAGLDAAGQRFSDVTLALDGRLSAHRLTLEAVAGRGMPLTRAALALEAGLSADRQRYAGQLSPLEVDSEAGDIRLEAPLAFDADIGAGSAQVQPFCLRREQGGRVCLDEPLQASAEQGRAVLSVSDLSMEILEQWLPPEWRAEGETRLSLTAEWRQSGAQWGAQADLVTTLSLQGLDAYGQPWTLPNSRLTLQLDASQARVDLDLGLQLDDAGRIGLALALDDPRAWRPGWPTGP